MGHVPIMSMSNGNQYPAYTVDEIHPNTIGRQINADFWRLALIEAGVAL